MKRSKSPRPPNGLLDTVSYFSFFAYAPDFDQIFTFFPSKTSKKELFSLLERHVASKRLLRHAFHGQNSHLYTLPQYSNHFRNRASRHHITEKKLRSVFPYLKALSFVPFVRMVGISGSASMDNCKGNADVDLMVVTARNLLFTGRFLAILLAAIYGVRHSRGACLNLFLDESDLTVPPAKRSLYTAHEVLQLKPVIDKGNLHARFLQANRWTRDFFPNAPAAKCKNSSKKYIFFTQILQPLEFLLKKIQLAIIRKNATGHLISPTQLWLFREDFKNVLAITKSV